VPRRYVSQLGHQEAVDQVFLASQKQLRPNRNGNLYMQVDLSDRTGSISARMWNASDADYRAFEDGDFVRVEGSTQLFQGAIQLIANNICRARTDEVDLGDFTPLANADIDRLAVRLGEMLRKIKDPHLLALAGIKHHHAYHGGLLQHVTNLMEVVLRIVDRFPMLDPDLLLLGAFLHDMGKVDELSYERSFSYTDEGQLLGHLVMAVGMLDTKIAETEKLMGEPFPNELTLRLKHMIVSHHGQYEYGSPKLPMTLEAVALHQLDNLDAKIHNFYQQLSEDPNVESPWTSFNHGTGRKLFKGYGHRRDALTDTNI
jgi:3'-5' exoribonuclease